MSQIRLDKFLSNAGCGTRTEVKQLLKKGLITVNGAAVTRPEQKIDPDKDQVLCREQKICLEAYRYYMLNKPAGYLSATEDRHQPVVLDLLKEVRREELFPVGRLDIDTEGLLLLTNDGALAHELLSPRKHVDKRYYAVVEGIVTEEDCRSFREGLDIGEKKKTMPAFLEILRTGKAAAESLRQKETLAGVSGKAKAFEAFGQLEERPWYSEIRVTIQEGKFHQVKRMFEAVGKKVVYLKRISMGSLRLDDGLKSGAYRALTEEEIEGLKKHAGTERSGHI